jgi:hypothetical protein
MDKMDKMYKLDKDVFISTMELIREQIKIDNAAADAFGVILPDSGATLYDNNALYNATIMLLRHLFNDGSDVIGYYIWECNFGERCYLEEGGIEVPSKTIEDIYEVLIKNMVI